MKQNNIGDLTVLVIGLGLVYWLWTNGVIIHPLGVAIFVLAVVFAAGGGGKR